MGFDSDLLFSIMSTALKTKEILGDPTGLQLFVQSVPFTTKLVASNPIHGEMYSIQDYVIKFVSDSRQVSGFRLPHH